MGAHDLHACRPRAAGAARRARPGRTPRARRGRARRGAPGSRGPAGAAARHPPWPRTRSCDGAPGTAARAVRRARGSLPGDAADDGHLPRLRVIERRQQSRGGPREEGLAGSWRAHQQQVVAARDGHLEGPAGVLLATHVGEVRGARPRPVAAPPPPAAPAPAARSGRAPRSPRRGWAGGARAGAVAAARPGHESGHIVEAVDADDLHASTRRGLLAVASRARRPADGPAARSVETMGSTPRTGMTLPSSDSSPSSAQAPPEARSCSDASRMPMAMATS